MSKYYPNINKRTGELFLEKKSKEIQGLPMIKKTKRGRVELRREIIDFLPNDVPYFSIIVFDKNNEIISKIIKRPFQIALKTFRKSIKEQSI